MDKVISQVFETEDYEQFHKLEDNRDVLEGRLKKLMASFSIKSILNPIIVNKNMEIVDGQGRYEARVYFSDYMRNRGENAASYQNMHTYYKETNVETLRRAK